MFRHRDRVFTCLKSLLQSHDESLLTIVTSWSLELTALLAFADPLVVVGVGAGDERHGLTHAVHVRDGTLLREADVVNRSRQATNINRNARNLACLR